MLFEAKTKNERSIETILDNTMVIDTFKDKFRSDDTFQVRTMLSRTQKGSQHFIVTSARDVYEARGFSSVKSIAEVAIRGDRLRFTVNPARQFPNSVLDGFVEKVEHSVALYMKKIFSVHVNSNKSQTNDKREPERNGTYYNRR